MIAALTFLAAATGIASSETEAASLPPRTVLILVAPWCAPCRGELARIERLVEAAGPFAVRAMAADETAAARTMLLIVPPWRRWDPERTVARAARRQLLARTPGLPYSVAVDATGEICADRNGGLDAAAVRAMLRRCGVGPDEAP